MNDEERDDIDFEPEDEFGETGAAQAKIQKLRAELKEAQQKRDEYLAGWQREKADAVNAKREASVAHERHHARGKESVIEEIIPVLDSFDIAAGSDAWENVDDNWRNGMDQIRNQLLGVLSRHGIERYGKIGEQYDHNLHEVVQELDHVAGESGEIVKILRFGYKNGSHIIRPAHVIVKK
ncbi:MAG TPA: nucleotide exchange factor GrpE [Candidatus Paceibacterota bacterium]|nr:nucleotide exchange factor GrpE [Candidatus Paceibacterota bacterium]